MIRLRTLPLLALALAGAAVRAAEGDLAIAREALRDGLWKVAREHALRAGGSEGKLVALESLAGAGDWNEIRRLLSEWRDEKGDGFDYYRAVAGGRHDEAMAILRRGGSAEGVEAALLHEAQTLAKQGRRAEAEEAWRKALEAENPGELALAAAGIGLMDAAVLQRAYAAVGDPRLRRSVGLRLGMARLRDPKSRAEGESMIRTIVRENPDAEGAREAYLAMADAQIAEGRWEPALATYREAAETWPDAVGLASVHEGKGWALQKLGRREEALEAFRQAALLAADDSGKAVALAKAADVLADLGRNGEAMEQYREVMRRFPKTTVAEKLHAIVRLREREAEGRRLYSGGRFAEAMRVFGEVAESDSSRRQRMAYFRMLCLYGEGREAEAQAEARALVDKCSDPQVRAEALLWLAKLLYNRREWAESGRLFAAYAELRVAPEAAAEALLWAVRAAMAGNDFPQAIVLSTRLSGDYPDSAFRFPALGLQGEALVELARFDEAVLVFDRILESGRLAETESVRIRIRRADALYAMGADNAAGYETALEAYQAIRSGAALTASDRIVVSFRIARTLAKLRRQDESVDQFYAQVVLAYREGCRRGEQFTDEARAAFSRAAFRLAEEFELRGRDRQAAAMLELLAASGVPAAAEARNRLRRMHDKGGFP